MSTTQKPNELRGIKVRHKEGLRQAALFVLAVYRPTVSRDDPGRVRLGRRHGSDPPKSDSARRTVPIIGALRPYLVAHQLRAGGQRMGRDSCSGGCLASRSPTASYRTARSAPGPRRACGLSVSTRRGTRSRTCLRSPMASCLRRRKPAYLRRSRRSPTAGTRRDGFLAQALFR